MKKNTENRPHRWFAFWKQHRPDCQQWLVLLTICFLSCNRKEDHYKSWKVYGGSKDGAHYSSLTEIDTNNVNQLRVAWTFHTGDADTAFHTQIQCNPIVIDGVLFGTTPKMKLFALNAATGKQIWLFDPDAKIKDTSAQTRLLMMFSNTGRGVTYWTDGKNDKRVFYTAGDQLFCVNAVNGNSVTTFGNNGHVDLHEGLERDIKDRFITSNTPGIIYKDLLIMGSRVAEDASAAPGDIRAYDVHTGKIKWIFHTIPHPGEWGYDNTWQDKQAWKHVGGANCWAGMSLDEDAGIVFIPTGSVSFDFYGGKRAGDDLFGNCILALDAATGRRIWHFQTVHHDLWDRDLPTAPVLVRIRKNEKEIDAVAQATKTGFIFLLDRRTGKPIYPVEEKPVPTASELAGEQPSPSQPIPTLPKPFVRQTLTAADLNNMVADSSFQDIKNRLAGYKTGNMFNPPSKEGTVIFPGFDGGAEWGGPAFDPSTAILYVNSSEMPWVLTMVDVKDKPARTENYLEAGRRLYMHNCMGCHGPERKGSGNYPSLIGVNKKYDEGRFHQLISSGRAMMPAFNQLTEQEKSAMASFILDLKVNQSKKFAAEQKTADTFLHLPYTNTGYNKFLTKEGFPAVKPPWGTLTAINLNTGEFVWKDTLGDYPEFKAKGIHTGTENYGGPVVTAAGLLFIAATSDSKIRAFNKRTGKLLWEADLPACGFATPAVYNINGKQYVVIACGGGKLKTKSGDSYVAFALPGFHL